MECFLRPTSAFFVRNVLLCVNFNEICSQKISNSNCKQLSQKSEQTSLYRSTLKLIKGLQRG